MNDIDLNNVEVVDDCDDVMLIEHQQPEEHQQQQQHEHRRASCPAELGAECNSISSDVDHAASVKTPTNLLLSESASVSSAEMKLIDDCSSSCITTTTTTSTKATSAAIELLSMSATAAAATTKTAADLNTSPLNLKEILQLFSCAISQEQAWAVLYQVLSKLKHLLDSDLALVKTNLDRIDINVLNFDKDGTVYFDFEESPTITHDDDDDQNDIDNDDTENDQERALVESKALKSVAYLVFDALDYGNNYTSEPVLQSSLSHLLLLISGHYKEYNNSSKTVSEDDEGYEQEEEDSIGIQKAIEICNSNIAEADYHCKAVCRGLYAQAYELKVFLAKIEDSKNILQKSGKDPAHYCFEVLDKTDWAKLWMQVIHELRNGVKLRKVHNAVMDTTSSVACTGGSGSLSSPIKFYRRHIEYELTPFEILLDQIRARRYHLRKVQQQQLQQQQQQRSLTGSSGSSGLLGAAIKKDARDIILDFIRSRPPLKKSSQRKINRTMSYSKPVNLHEQLMMSIRNYSTPLRHVDQVKKSISLMSAGDASMNSSVAAETQEVKKKKLIKVDKKLLNRLTNSSDDDESEIDEDEIKNLPILQDLNDAGVAATQQVDNNGTGIVESTSFLIGGGGGGAGGNVTGDLSSIYYSTHQPPSLLSQSLMHHNQPSYYYTSHYNQAMSSAAAAAAAAAAASRKRIKAPESLKSPLTPWCDPVDNWRAYVTEEDLIGGCIPDVPPPPPQQSQAPTRRHTMTFADLNKLSSTLSSLNIFSTSKKQQQQQKETNSNSASPKKQQLDEVSRWAIIKSRLLLFSTSSAGVAAVNMKLSQPPVYLKHGPGYEDFGFVSTHDLIKKLQSNQSAAMSSSSSKSCCSNETSSSSSCCKDSKECLKLTFDELCHIRNVLTKAELDYLLFDNQLFNEVARGKVCFSCRKTKFSLFSWGHKCRICQQKVCKKCLRSVQFKTTGVTTSEGASSLPLFKLQPVTPMSPSSSLSSASSTGTSSQKSPDKYRTSLRVVEHVEQPQPQLDRDDFEVLSISSGGALSTLSGNGNARTSTSASASTSSFGVASSINIINNNNNSKQQYTFEICVDCYHMMEGVVVCANEADLTGTATTTVTASHQHQRPSTTVAYHKRSSPTQQQSVSSSYQRRLITQQTFDTNLSGSPSLTMSKSVIGQQLQQYNRERNQHHQSTPNQQHHSGPIPTNSSSSSSNNAQRDVDLSISSCIREDGGSGSGSGCGGGGSLTPSSSSSSSTSSYVDLTAESNSNSNSHKPTTTSTMKSREALSLNLQPVYDSLMASAIETSFVEYNS